MSDGLDQAVEALSAGTLPPIGRYTFDGLAWTWTDEIFAMHGFAPGEVVPSAALMLAHIDPDEVHGARLACRQALRRGLPYVSYHHLVDVGRHRRTVLVTGSGRLDGRRGLVELCGTMVDLTEAVHTDLQVQVAAALTGVTEHRAAIEQAKGMLMMALGLCPDEAFAVLRAHSQSSNIKVNDLAERMTASGITPWGRAGTAGCDRATQ